MNPQKQIKMKKKHDDIDANQRAAFEALVQLETASIEEMKRLQRRIGNYKGAFLLHEISRREWFLLEILEQQKQLSGS